MTDKELLELAAKAAGLHIDKFPHNGGGANNTGFDVLGNVVLDWHSNIRWNPLTNDSDALRLAAKLRLWVQISDRSVWIAQNTDEILGELAATTLVMFSDCAGDAYAATRRAIVRAAAEIGKAMP